MSSSQSTSSSRTNPQTAPAVIADVVRAENENNSFDQQLLQEEPSGTHEIRVPVSSISNQPDFSNPQSQEQITIHSINNQTENQETPQMHPSSHEDLNDNSNRLHNTNDDDARNSNNNTPTNQSVPQQVQIDPSSSSVQPHSNDQEEEEEEEEVRVLRNLLQNLVRSRSGAPLDPQILHHICSLRSIRLTGTRALGRGSYGTVLPVSFTSDAGEEIDGALKQYELNDLGQGRVRHEAVVETVNFLALGDNDHIIKFYLLTATQKSLPCLLLERADGNLTRQFVDDSPLLDISQVYSYSIQLARGLAHFHNKNLVHRDVKSANILLVREVLLKLTDLGSVGIVGEVMNVRTPLTFRPPEFYISQGTGYPLKTGPTFDVYLFGLVLLQMLQHEATPQHAHSSSGVAKLISDQIGSRPSDSNSHLHEILENFVLPIEIPTCVLNSNDCSFPQRDSCQLLSSLIKLCRRCLNVLPSQRPKDGSDLAQILNDLQRGGGTGGDGDHDENVQNGNDDDDEDNGNGSSRWSVGDQQKVNNLQLLLRSSFNNTDDNPESKFCLDFVTQQARLSDLSSLQFSSSLKLFSSPASMNCFLADHGLIKEEHVLPSPSLKKFIFSSTSSSHLIFAWRAIAADSTCYVPFDNMFSLEAEHAIAKYKSQNLSDESEPKLVLYACSVTNAFEISSEDDTDEWRLYEHQHLCHPSTNSFSGNREPYPRFDCYFQPVKCDAENPSSYHPCKESDPLLCGHELFLAQRSSSISLAAVSILPSPEKVSLALVGDDDNDDQAGGGRNDNITSHHNKQNGNSNAISLVEVSSVVDKQIINPLLSRNASSDSALWLYSGEYQCARCTRKLPDGKAYITHWKAVHGVHADAKSDLDCPACGWKNLKQLEKGLTQHMLQYCTVARNVKNENSNANDDDSDGI